MPEALSLQSDPSFELSQTINTNNQPFGLGMAIWRDIAVEDEYPASPYATEPGTKQVNTGQAGTESADSVDPDTTD